MLIRTASIPADADRPRDAASRAIDRRVVYTELDFEATIVRRCLRRRLTVHRSVTRRVLIKTAELNKKQRA